MFRGVYDMNILGRLAAVVIFLMPVFLTLWGEILVMEHIIALGSASGLISAAILYSVVFICLFIVFFYVDLFLFALLIGAAVGSIVD